MIGTFPGKLALAEGEEVDVDLEIAGGKLRLTTGVSEIGSWPTELCAITPVGDGYRLTLEGEHVAFTPDHPEAFAAVVRGMDPTSKSRTAPVPISDPDPDINQGYNLEAALDQVLGGSEDDHHAAVLDDSPADIAVTLEALFATAYPEFDEEDDTESVFADTSPASTDPEPASPIVSSEPTTVDGLPVPADETPVFAAEEDAFAQPGEDAEQPAPFEFGVIDEESDEAETPVGWEPTVVDDLEPAEEASTQDDGALDELLGIDEADEFEPTQVESRFPAAVGFEDDLDDPDDLLEPAGAIEDAEPEPFDEDEELDAVASYDPADTEDTDTEDTDTEDGGVDPFGHGRMGDDRDRLSSGPFRPSAPAAYDDGDVYHDSPYGSDSTTPRYSPGHSFPSPAEEQRPAASFGYRDEPSYGHESRPAASFDLDSAVDDAGYSPPPLGGGIDRHDAEDGMFSRSASERFASVSGAIRSRLASTESDSDVSASGDEMSIADQIVAEQQESDHEQRGKRFTPDLVKKLAIGGVILFVIAGLVLVTPALIGLVIDQIDTPEAVETTPTTAVAEENTGVTATTLPDIGESVTPEEETEPMPALLSDSVFSLEPAQFAERWDTIVETASLKIGDGFADGNAVGFTQYVGVRWVVGDDGLISSYQVILDPSGEPRDDELGIGALGVAIDVSHPEYDGGDLQSVLLALGLDVSQPSLDLDGSTVRDGVRYTLVFNQQELVVLNVSPASAGPTTTSTTTEP